MKKPQETPTPRFGSIMAAEAIARLLWQTVEDKVANQADDREHGGDGDE